MDCEREFLVDDGAKLERFFARLAAEAGTPPIDEAEARPLLDLARVVAHLVERRFAPLSTYVAGLALDPSLPATERAERVRGVIDVVQRLASEEFAEHGDGGGSGPG